MGTALRDVARKAGVSTSTASRVLNDVRSVSITPATQQRVRAAAVEIGYQPNQAARALAKNRMRALGLWTLDLRSAYSSRVIGSMSEMATAYEFDLMVGKLTINADGSIDTSRITSWPVDGILMTDVPGCPIHGLDRGLLGDIPVTGIGVTVIDGADQVWVDFQTQVMEAVRHLRDMGCGRIAYLLPLPVALRKYCGDTRIDAYQTAMAELGLPIEMIMACDETREAVMPALCGHIRHNGRPDGLLCFDNNMAIGAAHALRELGIRIPADVALIGCDGVEGGLPLDPQLTTIELPLEKMCATACMFLRARIENPSLPIQHATFVPRLDVKGSSMRSDSQ